MDSLTANETKEFNFYFISEGLIFPSGVNLILYPLCMQRREDLYPNSMEFNPDRFLNDHMNKANSFSYVPFSAGPRNCIGKFHIISIFFSSVFFILGQKFAMNEMKCVLAKVLMSLKLLPGTEKYPVTELSGEMILKSEEGVYMTITKR